MVTTAIVLLLAFIGVEFAGYLFHRLMHTKWLGPLHRAHMAHHLAMYPPQDYLSKSYRKTGTDSTTWRFVAFGTTIGLLALWLTPIWISLPVVIALVVMGGLNSYMHDTIHVSPHVLERFDWFLDLRVTHHVHHVEMGKNFGVVTFWADRIFGTFRRVFRWTYVIHKTEFRSAKRD